MSSDNGIYIGEWLGPNGPEYRVTEAMAIDNCYYNSDFPKEFIDSQVFQYFGQCKVYHDLGSAQKEACRINKDMLIDGLWTEYGICHISFEHPFPLLNAESAKQIENDYWLNWRRNCVRP